MIAQNRISVGELYASADRMRRPAEKPVTTIQMPPAADNDFNTNRQDNVLEAAENATRTELGSIVDTQGWDREAEELETDLMQRSSRALDRQRRDTLVRVFKLASRYTRDRRFEEAEKLALEVVNAHVELYSKHDPDTIAAMSDLGWIYLYQGRLKKQQTYLPSSSRSTNGNQGANTLLIRRGTWKIWRRFQNIVLLDNYEHSTASNVASLSRRRRNCAGLKPLAVFLRYAM
ncbi:hypothetical protein DL769_011142 [Monosporascus sp. CRB-8-3]|nr:hypothetical protein DL769_011142 [Monosporascus sp. CRB-8-3]